jgi:hypothetical protein
MLCAEKFKLLGDITPISMKEEDTTVLSERKPESYISALSKAWEALFSQESDEVAKRSLASYDSQADEFTLSFFGQDYSIQPSKKVVIGPDEKEVKPFITVLLLHYLASAKDIEPEGRVITFRELVGGDVYYDAFSRRAIIPITRTFGSKADALREAGKVMGAREESRGDCSLVIDVLPKIPVTVTVWEGDDEVPASANMLFDASIKEQLPTEDVAVIGGFVASMLIKNKPEWHDGT